MKNIKIYVLALFISLLFVSSIFISSSKVTTLLLGIGSSGIAATIMAFFLEIAEEKREKRKIEMSNYLFFEQINSQLSIFFEKLLWLDERIDDERFDWSLNDSAYSNINYLASMKIEYPDVVISYDEAIDRVKHIGENYAHELFVNLSQVKKNKVQKMFRILSMSSKFIINEMNTIKKNAIVLDREGFLSLNDNKQLVTSLALALGLMPKANVNYQVVIDNMIQVSQLIRKTGNYKNDIQIGPQISFSIDEL